VCVRESETMHEGGGGSTRAGVGGGRGRLLLAMEWSSLPIKLNPHTVILYGS
jgi:hypothetical protein